LSTDTVPEAQTDAVPEQGYFPHWKLKTSGIVMPDERLLWGQTLFAGLQHGVAMAGGTIIAPLIMGFDPNLALLFSGVGTLIFFVVVGGRVPSYLGSSFSFVAVVLAVTGYSGHGPNAHLDVALGGIIAAGVLYGAIALIVMWSGVGWIERLMPPPVTGAVIAAIGLNLAPVAVKSVSSGSGFDALMGLATVLITALVAVSASGAGCRSSSGPSADICCIGSLPTASDGASPSISRHWLPRRGSACRSSRSPSSTPKPCSWSRRWRSFSLPRTSVTSRPSAR